MCVIFPLVERRALSPATLPIDSTVIPVKKGRATVRPEPSLYLSLSTVVDLDHSNIDRMYAAEYVLGRIWGNIVRTCYI
jgi:hypothetical protein